MIGQTISHYKILEKLGEGGMGVVYKAHDTKLDRAVALKFLPIELTKDRDARERFIHEAKAASALDHTNICTIHEIDETDNGQLYIAVACYDGETLKDKIERSPLKVDDAINITTQIALGLSKAHEKSIVHRDIKPANILITTDGTVKILDFGLAKLRGLTKLTKTGSTVGTAPYMSPEQVKGDTVDHRTDVWSLGVVLYEMLTGQLPFKGDYEQAIAYQITNVAPEPVTGLRSGIPLELERVVNKCLEKTPDERYQTTADLIADLKHIQRTISQSITPTSQLKQTHVRKRKYWYRMAAAVITVLVAVGIYLFILPTQPSSTHKRTIAVLPFANLSGNQEDEYFTDGIMEDILTQLSKIGELNVISRTTMMQYKGMKKSLREIGNEVHAGVVLEGSARRSGNRIRISSQLIDAETDKHLWAETYDRDMKDVFAIQSDVAQKIAEALKVKLTPREKEHIEKIPTKNTEAYDYYIKGREYYLRYKKQDNERAIELFKKAILLDSMFADALANLGYAYCQRVFRYGFPVNWYDSAMQTSTKAITLDKNSSMAYLSLALVYYLEGFINKSIEASLKSKELSHHADNVIASSYFTLGELSKSLQYFKECLLIEPIHVGEQSAIGDIYRIIGDTRKAEHFIKKDSELQFDHPAVYFYTIRYYLSQGRDYEAKELINKLSDLNVDNPIFFKHAGYVSAMTKNLIEAKQYYQRSLALRSSSETINDSSGGTMWGYILMKEAKRDQVQKVLSKEEKLAMEQVQRGCQRGDPELTLSMIYAIKGKKKEAYTYLQKAIVGGQRDYQLILRDPRFENIRNDEEFKKLIAQMKAKVDEQKKLIEQMEKEESQ